VYVSFAAGVYASTADIAGALLASLGVHVGWVWLAVVGWAVTMVFAYVSFGLSSLVILICEGVAVLLIAVVGIVVLARGGYHHHALSTAPVSRSRACVQRPGARGRQRVRGLFRV